MKRILSITLLLLISFSLVSAQDVSKQSEQKKKIEGEIAEIDNQLKSISSKQKANSTQYSLLTKQVANRKSLITEIDGEIRDLDKRIFLKNVAINDLQKEVDTLEVYYNNLIYNTYKNRDTKVWFMYILASENIGQGYRRFSYLKNLSNVVNEQASKIKSTQSLLEAEKAELQELKSSAKAVKNTKQREYNKLIKEEKRSKQIARILSQDQTKYRRQLALKKKEVEKLNREIERILSKTISSEKKNNTAVDYTLAGLFEQNKGKLPWPVKQGVVTDKFGIHQHPVYKNIKMPENNGITISTSKNATVYCVFDGVVKQILLMPGYDQCVLVQHGTYFTFYCKLKNVSVKAGQKIKTSEPIGTLQEDEGLSSLHFQIWNGTKKQNPEVWLR